MNKQVGPDGMAERILDATAAALDLLHVYVGDRLGLYRAMTDTGPVSADELAARCGLAERYVREWLEHQTVAGIVTIDDGSDGDRRFGLPPGHAEALCDGDSLAFVSPLALGVVGIARALPHVLEAFRTGGGVPYEAYGADLRGSIAALNRPQFLHLLASEWFPSVPGLVDRLVADPPARVADIGCGTGWSTIAIALGYPQVEATGVDLDRASIDEARANAETAGVADRVRFEVRDATQPGLPAGAFDLVCAFETIHDMCDPVSALAAMRGLTTPEGTVLVVDERVADTFTAEPEAGERFQWGWSALHCLPCALTEPPAAGTGTIMRAPILRDYAVRAGFAELEVLPIDNDFWRFYRLVD